MIINTCTIYTAKQFQIKWGRAKNWHTRKCVYMYTYIHTHISSTKKNLSKLNSKWSLSYLGNYPTFPCVLWKRVSIFKKIKLSICVVSHPNPSIKLFIYMIQIYKTDDIARRLLSRLFVLSSYCNQVCLLMQYIWMRKELYISHCLIMATEFFRLVPSLRVCNFQHNFKVSQWLH